MQLDTLDAHPARTPPKQAPARHPISTSRHSEPEPGPRVSLASWNVRGMRGKNGFNKLMGHMESNKNNMAPG
eukprot:5413790-Prymnesium_polylepis.1